MQKKTQQASHSIQFLTRLVFGYIGDEVNVGTSLNGPATLPSSQITLLFSHVQINKAFYRLQLYSCRMAYIIFTLLGNFSVFLGHSNEASVDALVVLPEQIRL